MRCCWTRFLPSNAAAFTWAEKWMLSAEVTVASAPGMAASMRCLSSSGVGIFDGRIATAILREAMRYAEITFTELGAQKVRDFLDAQGTDTSNAGLRLGVRGGGC